MAKYKITANVLVKPTKAQLQEAFKALGVSSEERRNKITNNALTKSAGASPQDQTNDVVVAYNISREIEEGAGTKSGIAGLDSNKQPTRPNDPKFDIFENGPGGTFSSEAPSRSQFNTDKEYQDALNRWSKQKESVVNVLEENEVATITIARKRTTSGASETFILGKRNEGGGLLSGNINSIGATSESIIAQVDSQENYPFIVGENLKKTGFDPAGFERLFVTNQFLLQSVNQPRNEKFQLLETFSEPVLYMFGERQEVFTFTGILLDTKSHSWRREFLDLYQNTLRGTRLAELGASAFITYRGQTFEGFVISTNVQDSVGMYGAVTFSITVVIRKRKKDTEPIGLETVGGVISSEPDAFIIEGLEESLSSLTNEVVVHDHKSSYQVPILREFIASNFAQINPIY
jgi:hypothetical protein